ncbi:hypothetical protein TSAR_013243, partial [Trichomalopsis sarcophagae]
WFESAFFNWWHCVRYTKKHIDSCSDSLDRKTPRSVPGFWVIIKVHFETLYISIMSCDKNISFKILGIGTFPALQIWPPATKYSWQGLRTHVVVKSVLGCTGGSPVVVGVQVARLISVPPVLVEVGLVAGLAVRLVTVSSSGIVVRATGGVTAALLGILSVLGAGARDAGEEEDDAQEMAHQVEGVCRGGHVAAQRVTSPPRDLELKKKGINLDPIRSARRPASSSTPKMTTTTATVTATSLTRDVDSHIVTLLSKLSALREHNHQREQQHNERKQPMSIEARSLELWRSVAVECFATFLFAFVVAGAAIASSVSGSGLNVLATAIASGFAIAAVQLIFGPVSGGHVNPAVSVSFALSRKVSPLRAGLYVAAQCGGGIAGAAMLYGVANSPQTLMISPGRLSEQALLKLLVELSLSVLVVLAHFASESPKTLSSTISAKPACVLAAAYTAATLVSSPFLNPARALGPAFVMNKWDNHWVYWIGPIAGGAIAAVLHEYVLSNNRRSRDNRDLDDGESSSMRSDDETYDDLDKGAPKFPGAYATYRPVAGAASIYGPPPSALERVESIYGGTKSLYCKSPPLTRANLNRSQSVYAKSTSGTRDGLILPKPGPLVPAQSLYPIRLNTVSSQAPGRELMPSGSQQQQQQPQQQQQQQPQQQPQSNGQPSTTQNHNSTNQNMQNQLQQCTQNIYGIRGITTSLSTRDGIYGHLGSRENGTITTGGGGASNIYGRAPAPPPSNHGPPGQQQQQQQGQIQSPPTLIITNSQEVKSAGAVWRFSIVPIEVPIISINEYTGYTLQRQRGCASSQTYSYAVAVMANEEKTSTIFELDFESELRLDKKKTLIVVLKEGTAEVFGAELTIGLKYEFMRGGAVFTWKGCTVEVFGQANECYVFKATEPMLMYLNCHMMLEDMRRRAEVEERRGPILMVAGPSNSGRSTLCRILLNYAVRLGRKPVFVNLDVGQGHIGIPGTIGALLVGRPSNVVDGFSQEAPLVFHFGHLVPDSNWDLYNQLVSSLSEACIKRLDANKKINKATGIIINTCGFIEDEGYKSVLRTARAFKVNAILALDDRLYSKLYKDLPKVSKVLRLRKSGGVGVRTPAQRTKEVEESVMEYFYGTRTSRITNDEFYKLRTLPLYPHSFEMKWSELKIYKFVCIDTPPLSCLPYGTTIKKKSTILASINPGPDILHHIFSVSFVDSPEDNIMQANVAGFVCVTGVDVEHQTLTILSPQPRLLPNIVLLQSEIKFVDEVHGH